MWSGPRSTAISVDTVQQIILAIVVAIALLILAMSLALSAAETRDERDVLVSLGAPPRTMRGVAAWKAATLSFVGAALAIPTGFIPVAVAYHAAVRPGDAAHLHFPWSTAIELLLLAPLIGALVAYIGSGIAQRVRPTQMSTFATD
jgi:putative ABC transport system permease protein